MVTLASIKLIETECSCAECASYCKNRPCWGTPDEARKLINAGFGGRLMMDWWVGSRYDNEADDIMLLCPAIVGREQCKAPDLGFALFMSHATYGPCTFHKSNLCQLHDMGLKPSEGRMVNHDYDKSTSGVHEAIAQSWNNPEAQELVRQWQIEYGGCNE